MQLVVCNNSESFPCEMFACRVGISLRYIFNRSGILEGRPRLFLGAGTSRFRRRSAARGGYSTVSVSTPIAITEVGGNPRCTKTLFEIIESTTPYLDISQSVTEKPEPQSSCICDWPPCLENSGAFINTESCDRGKLDHRGCQRYLDGEPKICRFFFPHGITGVLKPASLLEIPCRVVLRLLQRQEVTPGGNRT